MLSDVSNRAVRQTRWRAESRACATHGFGPALVGIPVSFCAIALLDMTSPVGVLCGLACLGVAVAMFRLVARPAILAVCRIRARSGERRQF